MDAKVMILWIVLVSVVNASRKCGVCTCSDSFEEMYCTDRELNKVPSVPRIAVERIRIMALQGNNISVLR